jgi:hypothetical protein
MFGMTRIQELCIVAGVAVLIGMGVMWATDRSAAPIVRVSVPPQTGGGVVIPQNRSEPCVPGYHEDSSSVNANGVVLHNCLPNYSTTPPPFHPNIVHTCAEGMRWVNDRIGCIDFSSRREITKEEGDYIHDMAVTILREEKDCEATGGRYSQRTGECSH